MHLTEQEIRALRDRVFGQVSSDSNWEGCKDNWMKPAQVKWLQSFDKPRVKEVLTNA